MNELEKLKNKVIQYYLDNPQSEYNVDFIPYWRGNNIFSCHTMSGDFVVIFSQGLVRRRFSWYVGACTDEACDRIINDIRKTLRQSMTKHYIQKWLNGQNI